MSKAHPHSPASAHPCTQTASRRVMDTDKDTNRDTNGATAGTLGPLPRHHRDTCRNTSGSTAGTPKAATPEGTPRGPGHGSGASSPPDVPRNSAHAHHARHEQGARLPRRTDPYTTHFPQISHLRRLTAMGGTPRAAEPCRVRAGVVWHATQQCVQSEIPGSPPQLPTDLPDCCMFDLSLSRAVLPLQHGTPTSWRIWSARLMSAFKAAESCLNRVRSATKESCASRGSCSALKALR